MKNEEKNEQQERINPPKFEIVETTENCCANCKGINTNGFAWIYCEVRKDNDDKFNGDCGETLGCNRFVSALAKRTFKKLKRNE